MMQYNTCGTCFYRVGSTCHRFPPGLLPNVTRIWPTIALEDVCGEYSPIYGPVGSDNVTCMLPLPIPPHRSLFDVEQTAPKPLWKFWR